MAKRRAPSKESAAKQACLFEDTLDSFEFSWGTHPIIEEEENEDAWCDSGDSACNWWEEWIQNIRLFVWWMNVNLEALIEQADIRTLCMVYDQVDQVIESERELLSTDDLQDLLAIKHLLYVAMINAQMALGWANSSDRFADAFDGEEPPVRRKLRAKSPIPPDVEEDPRDDRTSWKRGLIRTRFGVMSVKDAREANMELGSDEWKKLIHVDAASRVRVRKPWMIRGARRRHASEVL